MSAIDYWDSIAESEQVGVPAATTRIYTVAPREWRLPFDKRTEWQRGVQRRRKRNESVPASASTLPGRDLTIQQRRRNGGAL